MIIEKDKDLYAVQSDVNLLDGLEVGDSFLWDVRKRNSMAATASIYFHRTTTKKFRSTVRNQPEGKVRFWREE